MTEPLAKAKKEQKASPSLSKGSLLLGFSALFSLLLFLRNAELATGAMSDALRLCATTLIPSLFPFLVLSEVVVNTGAGVPLGRLLRRPFRRLFGVSESGACAVLLGLLCGFPVGTRCVLSLYRQGAIGRREAEHLLTFCNTPSSAFLISTVGYSLFHSRSFGYLLLGSTLLSAVVVGILGNLIKKKKGDTSPMESVAPSPMGAPPRQEKVSVILSAAIQTSALSMLKICAFVVFFSTVAAALSAILSRLSISSPLLALLLGLWEMTGGVRRSAALSFYPREICAALVGWSGFSVHLQMIGLCDGVSLSFRPYFLARLLQGILNFILVFLWLRLF